ncbi:MAG: diaminopimelate dehydrogenase [Clostridia bacterium]|nr:diaminopimelate dehydrogenase [Clostridia bacterium]
MIKVGIVGYGNLGRGAALAVKRSDDMECVGIFTRRDPEKISPETGDKTYPVSELKNFKGKIDVLLLCGGSATDLPETSAGYLKDFNTVDTFDTHAKIPEYLKKLDATAKENGTLGAISIGWDPGVFSLSRLLFGSVLPNGKDYTFWGKGVSQGHSDAIRRIKGVKDAVQFTVPIEDAVNSVRRGENPELSAAQKHLRECFVVAEDNADKTEIEKAIKEMPNYFADYNVTVTFVSEEELKEKRGKLPHGGFVIRSGETTESTSMLLELSLKLDSNPEFTGSVLAAYARAVAKMAKEGKTGAVTAFDIPFKYLSPLSYEEQIKTLL